MRGESAAAGGSARDAGGGADRRTSYTPLPMVFTPAILPGQSCSVAVHGACVAPRAATSYTSRLRWPRCA